MIISKITDGLGNQIFQYALGRRLAIERKKDLILDITWYNQIEEKFTKRQFLLDRLKINAGIAPQSLIDKFENPNLPPGLRRLHYIIEKKKPYYKQKIIKEKTLDYDPNILKCGKSVLLKGFWQSEKYFNSIREIILKEIIPRNLSADILDYSNKIAQTPHSVAVHFRRTDYVQQNSEHILLTPDYYANAVKFLRELRRAPYHFFIFSDDTDIPQAYLKIFDTYEIAKSNKEHPEYDLWLMSQCQSFIMANSSFSWWGAWLGRNPNKIVLAPDRRHKNKQLDSPDFLPETWYKINVEL